MNDEKLKEAQKRKEAIIAHIVTAVVTFVVGSIIFIIYFFTMGHRYIDAVNGSALTTIVLFASTILSILARLGAFDTFAYGFIQMGHAIFSKNPRKFNSMADYKQAKYEVRKQKRNTYIPMLIVTGLFALALIVLEIIYHTFIGQ